MGFGPLCLCREAGARQGAQRLAAKDRTVSESETPLFAPSHPVQSAAQPLALGIQISTGAVNTESLSISNSHPAQPPPSYRSSFDRRDG